MGLEDPHDTYGKLVGRAMPGYDIFFRYGASSVFGAYSWGVSREVALKILTVAEASDQRIVKAFARQGKCLENLPGNDNVVPVLAVGKVSDMVLAVMELVRGQSVATLIRGHGPLTWKSALEVSIEIARALRKAQDLDLAERGLHPERILLGTDGAVRVSFCGIPRLHRPDELPLYSHPEALRGEAAVDPSDVYLVGAILYYLATGDAPFAGKDAEEVTNLHLFATADLSKLKARGVPLSFLSLVERSLSKHPDDRYPNAAALLAAMRSVLGNDAPEYVIGSYKEVLTHLVKDEFEATKQGPPPEPEPALPQASTVRSGVRAHTRRRAANAAGTQRRPSTPTEPVRDPSSRMPQMAPGAASAVQPRGRGRPSARAKSPASLYWAMGIGGGALGAVLIVAFFLVSGGGGSAEPSGGPPERDRPSDQGDRDGPTPPKNGENPAHQDPPVDRANEIEALYARAAALAEKNDPRKCEIAWNEVIEIDAHYKDARKRRARALWEENEYEKALADLADYLERHPGEIESLLLEARCIEGLARVEDANAAYGRILEREPGNLEALERRARLHEKKSDWFHATLDYFEAVNRGRTGDEARNAFLKAANQCVQANWQRLNGGAQPAEAQRILEETDKLLAAGVDGGLLRLTRALMYIRQGRPESDNLALTHLEQAMAQFSREPGERKPIQAIAYYFRTAIDTRTGRADDALKDARLAFFHILDIAPAAEVLQFLAQAYRESDPPRSRAYALLEHYFKTMAARDPKILREFLAANPDLQFGDATFAPYLDGGAVWVLQVPQDWAGTGISRGDRILSYDGAEIRYLWELEQAVASGKGKPGTATCEVARSGSAAPVALALSRGDFRVQLGIEIKLK